MDSGFVFAKISTAFTVNTDITEITDATTKGVPDKVPVVALQRDATNLIDLAVNGFVCACSGALQITRPQNVARIGVKPKSLIVYQ